MLDEAITYIARDSRPAAERVLVQALDAAASLDRFSERGRVVPEFNHPAVRELLVQPYRLIYEVAASEVQILAFIHGARDDTDTARTLTAFNANYRLQPPAARSARCGG